MRNILLLSILILLLSSCVFYPYNGRYYTDTGYAEPIYQPVYGPVYQPVYDRPCWNCGPGIIWLPGYGYREPIYDRHWRGTYHRSGWDRGARGSRGRR